MSVGPSINIRDYYYVDRGYGKLLFVDNTLYQLFNDNHIKTSYEILQRTTDFEVKNQIAARNYAKHTAKQLNQDLFESLKEVKDLIVTINQMNVTISPSACG
jgi:hypothetical protein